MHEYLLWVISIPTANTNETMKNMKVYEADDKMINIIRDDYSILQVMGSFGIKMGFGDKTVREVCEEQGVDTYTFITVVNFCVNGYKDPNAVENLSIETLLHYLKAAHHYFLDFELPYIRRELVEALDPENNLAKLILKLFDGYADSLRSHMEYEEKTVFPFVEKMLEGKASHFSPVETYSKHHDKSAHKLTELKSIIIKYLPDDRLRNNQLTATLYDIYNTEHLLSLHVEVEEELFVPTINMLEQKCKKSGVSKRISKMIGVNNDSMEVLSDRERDVVVAVVQGMSNKEIADHLCIALNTVITHRRNIAKKLQIHTPAGLTIYAIVNNLVDISTVNL